MVRLYRIDQIVRPVTQDDVTTGTEIADSGFTSCSSVTDSKIDWRKCVHRVDITTAVHHGAAPVRLWLRCIGPGSPADFGPLGARFPTDIRMTARMQFEDQILPGQGGPKKSTSRRHNAVTLCRGRLEKGAATLAFWMTSPRREGKLFR